VIEKGGGEKGEGCKRNLKNLYKKGGNWGGDGGLSLLFFGVATANEEGKKKVKAGGTR